MEPRVRMSVMLLGKEQAPQAGRPRLRAHVRQQR
jgi:hypothetical protein